MATRPQADPIVSAVDSYEGLLLARSIVGTTDPQQIAKSLDVFCAAQVGSGVEEVFFCELSIAAVFGLRLRDARRVVLKAHGPNRTPKFLDTVHQVQRYLFGQGFPCPLPILGPTRFAIGLAIVDEFVDVGEFADAHEPKIRREMAKTLAWLIELTSEVPEDVKKRLRELRWPEHDLWPPPHNALFDFEATAAGAEWIDEIASRAKGIADSTPSRMVVGHSDWSASQMRFEGGEVSVVYDWDSLALDKETIIVGGQAGTFTYNEHLEVPPRPSPQEAKLFVEDYEKARSTRFSNEELAAITAAATYAIAYAARCEHAIDPEGEHLAGSRREALSSLGEEYLHP